MSYLLIVFLLGLLIFVHEFGHFLAAQWMRIPLSRFSVGFGPKLWGFRRKGVEYRLAAIPFGGYVLPQVDRAEDLLRIPAWRRIVFALGGPGANAALTVLLFMACNALRGDLSFHGLVVAPFIQTAEMLVRILTAILQLFSRPGEIAGVLGIVAMGGRHVGLDASRAMLFSAMISMNLALLNLLPLPPLDGGKMVLDVLHRLQPRMARAYVPICAVGWVLLLGLVLYATVQDISRWLA